MGNQYPNSEALITRTPTKRTPKIMETAILRIIEVSTVPGPSKVVVSFGRHSQYPGREAIPKLMGMFLSETPLVGASARRRHIGRSTSAWGWPLNGCSIGPSWFR